MPKAEKHFDDLALLQAVQEQEVGIRVSTNDPEGFRRILYSAMRAAPHLRCRIVQCPRTPRGFLLLKTSIILPEQSVNYAEGEDGAHEENDNE